MTKNERMKRLEEESFLVIKPVIDRYDVESLLKLGAPKDEYDPTCRMIASGYARESGFGRRRVLTAEELVNLLNFVWHQDFGSWTEKVVYYPLFYPIAEELAPLLAAIVID